MGPFHEDMVKIYGDYENFIYRPKDRLIKGLVAGHGINDTEFVAQPRINGKQICHPLYRVWKGMLERCFDGAFSQLHTTYVGVTCSDSFLSFKSFCIWAMSNGYTHGLHLDKDLLQPGGSKIYSEETCVFLPPAINKFLVIPTRISTLPVGVQISRSNSRDFVSAIAVNGKKVHLGTFKSREDAHKAWQIAKLEHAKSFKCKHLERVINDLEYNIENNIETIAL